MKIKSIPLIILFLFINNLLFPQNNNEKANYNSVFVEFGGMAFFGSLNFEKTINHTPSLGYSFRCGLSAYRLKDYKNKLNPDLLLPFAVSFHYGLNHRIEFGIGETISSFVYFNHLNNGDKRIYNLHGSLFIGYRYSKKNMLVKCGYSPVYEFNKYYRHWAGFSLGYIF